jgi:hypothetical protein
VPPVEWNFTTDEAGKDAFEKAREALARGEAATIDNAIVVQMITAPSIFKDVYSELRADELEGRVTLAPGESIPLRLEIETEDETVVEELQLRPVLPRRPGQADFVGIAGELRVELELRPKTHPTISLRSTITASVGPSASANAAACRVLDAFGRNKSMTLYAPGLLPSEGLRETRAKLAAKAAKQVKFYRRLSEDIVAIERHTGEELVVPEVFEQEDVAAILMVAGWLRGEAGRATVGHIELTMPPGELARAIEGLEAGEAHATLPITERIFGRELSIGDADISLPPMKIIETRSTANSPHARVRVRIVPAAADAERPFKLNLPENDQDGPGPGSRVVVPSPGEILSVLGSSARSLM